MKHLTNIMVYEISKSNNKSVIVTHKHQAPHHRRPRQDAVECVNDPSLKGGAWKEKSD